jgi:hypothetical protein
MVTRRDYTAEAVEAAHGVMIELLHILGEYRDDIAVIGGWVPSLLIPDANESFVGSMDVDIALDHRKIHSDGYKTILKLLLENGYRRGPQPFTFIRTVAAGNRTLNVEIDLLAGEYEGTGKSHRSQRVQDVLPRKARGCDLAFELFEMKTIDGVLPSGGKDSVDVKVAAIVPFLTMKGMALSGRLKQKDPYDIYYCLKYYPGGLEMIADLFRPHIGNKLVHEGLMKINKCFASPEHVGPKSIADFEEVADPEERDLLMRDAYERVQSLMRSLDITDQTE